MPLFNSATALIFPGLVITQLLLTVILLKGDICPGQRGRVHKLFPIIAVLWLGYAVQQIMALAIIATLAYFYTQVKVSKTRDSGPTWLLFLINGLSFGMLAGHFASLPLGSGLMVLAQAALIGAAFTHLLLLVARSRLQAFHRILPFIGVIATMAVCVIVLILASSLEQSELELFTQTLLWVLPASILAVVIWCWHILKNSLPIKFQLSLSLSIVFVSQLFLMLST